MLLEKGDLIHIPADTCVIQIQNELALIERYRYTKKPEVGIFIKYDSGNEALIFVQNEYCLIHCKDINILRKPAC
jgi:hypothetical protein